MEKSDRVRTHQALSCELWHLMDDTMRKVQYTNTTVTTQKKHTKERKTHRIKDFTTFGNARRKLNFDMQRRRTSVWRLIGLN